ncbi:MAG TPA: glutamine amidotransferase [Candidatus Dormibacteraeota bacterium]|nr:glutamine amidotransferase [Candidatus Dormibacteraeota bacterium]
MFQFFFKYPRTIFSKGQFVLLCGWPKWTLFLLALAAAAGLAWVIRSRVMRDVRGVRRTQAGVIWLLQTLVVTLVLVLLWKPSIMIAELRPQQNIIALVVDDSRSMGITENGTTRQAAAVKALEGGLLDKLKETFVTRLYRLDSHATRMESLAELHASAPATHIGESLKQLVAETSDLPIGALVLLSDGSDNSGGIDLKTISALRNRRIPVHAVGFGAEHAFRDVEMDDANVAARVLPESRLAARVSFHQRGYLGRRSTLSVRDGDKVLVSREVTFGGEGKIQTETLLFNAGAAGAKEYRFSIDTLPDEENKANNTIIRNVNVESGKRRVLYVEGEPRWEYKFIRRAEDDDPIIHVASMMRTTENKIYRQGVADAKELADGFPVRAEELFGFQGLILGSVEAGYFTSNQLELIREFVDRRGGGLLLLGGRLGLADGGWGQSSIAELIPTSLPSGKTTFERAPSTVELTSAGTDNLICRLVDDPGRNAEQWKKLPYLADHQQPGAPKPGAAVLALSINGGRRAPLLITENYGRGRTAILATGGTWRWQMNQPVGDTSHDMFWRQLLRWLVADTHDHVVASVASEMLFDEGSVRLAAEVRDKDYLPAADASVEANILGPGGIATNVRLAPSADTAGTFQAEWTAEKPGSYVAEIVARRGTEEVGRDTAAFERVDGAAENFHTEQNRELLDSLASQTGGRYWRPEELSKLSSEIPYSAAGITMRERKPLWNMPIVFLIILALRAGEWLLRRRWGIV